MNLFLGIAEVERLFRRPRTVDAEHACLGQAGIGGYAEIRTDAAVEGGEIERGSSGFA